MSRCRASGAVGESLSCQILHEVDVREPERVVVDPTMFDIAACPVHLRGLEAMARSDHLGAAALMRLGLRGVEEPPAEPPSSMVLTDPKHIDVATSAPRPSGQPGYERTFLIAEFGLKEASVVDPGRPGVELVDAIVSSVASPSSGSGRRIGSSISTPPISVSSIRRPRVSVGLYSSK